MIDVRLLRRFQRQVLFQCESMLMAASDVNDGLKARNVHRIFYALQNLLNATANVSKALWGQGGKLTNERKLLRDSIGIADNSPLCQVNMRNNFEHFDERLDRWWRESQHHNAFDLNIMPRASALGFDNIDVFRVFDPKTTDITFWGDDFNVQQLINEVQQILPTLREAVNTPHWDCPPGGEA